MAAGYQEDVPSPTFNLVQVYQGADVDVWHFDLYRLKQAKDVFELGIEQALEEAITLIEWPEKLAGLLPPESLSIHLDLGEKDNERTAGIEIAKNWAHRLDAEHIRQAVAGGGHD